MTVFQLGSISTGTLRTEDLLPIFVSTIDSLNGDQPNTSYLGFSDDLPDDHMYWQSEEAMHDMEALQDVLQTLCPPFVYFGTLEGDGADFGFWPDMERLQETLTAATVEHTLTLPRNEEWEWQLEDEGVIINTNDHGNTTVMDMERNVLWSVV